MFDPSGFAESPFTASLRIADDPPARCLKRESHPGVSWKSTSELRKRGLAFRAQLVEGPLATHEAGVVDQAGLLTSRILP